MSGYARQSTRARPASISIHDDCHVKRALHDKVKALRTGTSALPRDADERFHMIQIALQSAASGGGQAVFGLRHAALEGFGAGDILGVFELARMHADITIGSIKQFLQV